MDPNVSTQAPTDAAGMLAWLQAWRQMWGTDHGHRASLSRKVKLVDGLKALAQVRLHRKRVARL
jgi:hypothetical protein